MQKRKKEKIWKPILITGSIRSGTTFVGRVLSKSNNVLYAWEPFQVGVKKINKKGVFDNWFEFIEIDSAKTDSVAEYLLSFQKIQLRDFTKLITSSINRILFESTILIKKLNKLFFHINYRLLFKDPIAIISVDWFHNTFNNIKVVVMIRNPLSFVESIVRLNWDIEFQDLANQPKLLSQLPSELGNKVKYYAKNKEISLVKKSILLWIIIHFFILSYKEKYKDILFIKLEILEKNPIKTFEEIFEFCELELTNKLKKRIQKPFTLNKWAWITNSSKNQEKKGCLAKKEIIEIKRETKVIASKLGY